MKDLLRNILDKHSQTIQTAQLQRIRNYDDELQHFDLPNPLSAPLWTFIEQKDVIYDTEIDKTTDEMNEDDYEIEDE